ncbi:MAG: tRNA(His) guanylyltransferase Thg1 family protein [Clostridiales bacterium]|nr:tRNA(His) guanylyltransferase Thg1 family protein [Clostridiales bacterium]
MPVNDDLGKRMKIFYEQIPKTTLIRRMPVIIRIDGKAFHTFTRGFQKPFDELLIKTMQETTKYLCENIQGCVLGYTQSDEITLVLVDYKKLNSAAWFDYEVQKMCSIAASMATMAFNMFFQSKYSRAFISVNTEEEKKALYKTYGTKCFQALFDARCFNIPKEEVTNCIYWRQLDASRNSIQMVGQANFSHKELQNKSCSDIQDMLITQRGVNWNDLPTYLKRGSCVVKEDYKDKDCYHQVTEKFSALKSSMRTRWIIDKNIPIFKGEGRKYIDGLAYVGEQ